VTRPSRIAADLDTPSIDLYRAVGRDQAEHDLPEAARLDLGDWARFEIGAATPVADTGNGTRLPVTADGDWNPQERCWVIDATSSATPSC
jgi:hypothetical protein